MVETNDGYQMGDATTYLQNLVTSSSSVNDNVTSNTILDDNITRTNGADFDVDSYLLDKLGPKSRDLATCIILTIVYSIILCTGVLGNICTCIVIARNNYMHTATNYYLFSLAISDVVTLILGLPIEYFSLWQAYPWILGEAACVFKSFVSEMTTYASVLTITAFTVERYIAICHPLKAHMMSNIKRATKIIVFLWILACVFALPYPIHVRVVYDVEYPNSTDSMPESAVCTVPKGNWETLKIFLQISTFMFFVVPMSIITVLYLMIGMTLRHSGISRTDSESSTNSSHKKGVIRMLVAVVVAFFVCWAPYHTQRLMSLYITEWTEELYNIQKKLFDFSGVFYLVSSTVNPILYNLMSKKYRKAFKLTICKCFLKNAPPANSRRQVLYSHTGHYTHTTAIHSEMLSRENSPNKCGKDGNRNSIFKRFSILSRLTKQSSCGSLSGSLPGSPRSPRESLLSNENLNNHRSSHSDRTQAMKMHSLEKRTSKDSIGKVSNGNNFSMDGDHRYNQHIHARENGVRIEPVIMEQEASDALLCKDSDENKVDNTVDKVDRPPAYEDVCTLQEQKTKEAETCL